MLSVSMKPYFTNNKAMICPNNPPVTSVGMKFPPGSPEEKERDVNIKWMSIIAAIHKTGDIHASLA